MQFKTGTKVDPTPTDTFLQDEADAGDQPGYFSGHAGSLKLEHTLCSLGWPSFPCGALTGSTECKNSKQALLTCGRTWCDNQFSYVNHFIVSTGRQRPSPNWSSIFRNVALFASRAHSGQRGSVDAAQPVDMTVLLSFQEIKNSACKFEPLA